MEKDIVLLLIVLALMATVPILFPSLVNKFLLRFYSVFQFVGMVPKNIAPFHARNALIRLFGVVWLIIFFWVLYMVLSGTMPEQT